MNNELIHYGVKGMKWGIRKRTISSRRLRRKIDDSHYVQNEIYRNKVTEDKDSTVINEVSDNSRERESNEKMRLRKNRLKKFMNRKYSEIGFS